MIVAMMLSISTATMAHDVRPEVRIVELANTIANDTVMTTSKKFNKIDIKYELNLNKNYVKIINFLDLDQEQSTILFDVQDMLRREFNRLNTIEDSKKREEWFNKTINHAYYIIGLTFDAKQSRMYKALLNTTLTYKGYVKYGEFCDLFDNNDMDATTADLSTEGLI